jgi:hypothetical protein
MSSKAVSKNPNNLPQMNVLQETKRFYYRTLVLVSLIIFASLVTVVLSWYQQNNLIQTATQEQIKLLTNSFANQNEQYIRDSKAFLSVISNNPSILSKNPSVCSANLKDYI